MAHYICLLAEAYDAEELERLAEYNRIINFALAYHKPKKIKKFKWSSRDKAGTAYFGSGDKAVAHGIAAMALSLSKGKIEASPQTYAIERARATGRRIVYMDNSGQFFTENGQLTEKTEGDIALRMEQHGREN